MQIYINKYMRQIISEDTTIPDVQRQVAGIGTSAVDQGAMKLDNYLQYRNQDAMAQNPNKLYPIHSIEQAISEAFVHLISAEKYIQVANNNPALKSKAHLFPKLESKLKQVLRLLVDFDETLSIINGDVK
jgi:hypothetical protein